MERVINFRDLGGISTGRGREVKKGLFYRSATLDEATDKDIYEIKALNLAVICDFRDLSEKENTKIYDKIKAPYRHLPIALDSARICNLQRDRSLKTAMIQLDPEDMCIAYRNLPFNNDSYKVMIELVRAGNVPILIHCSAGKDRAGVAAAILLLLLGANRENVIKDYLISKHVIPYVIKFISKSINILVRRKIIKKMMPVFLVEESYINASLDEIIKKYESFDKYFNIEYGISDTELSDIRAKYSTLSLKK